MKINIEDLMVKLILIFPITTILQVYNTTFNRIVFFLIILIIIILLFFNNNKKNNNSNVTVNVSMLLLLFSFAYSIYTTRKPFVNFNDFLYLPFWVFFLFYLSKRTTEFTEKLNQNKKFIKFTLLIFAITIALLLLINRNYFELGRHRMASGAFLAFVNGLFLYSKNNSKLNLMYLIFPFITVVFGFSRTYIVMLFVTTLLFLYDKVDKKELFIFKIFPIITIGIFLLFRTDVFDRFFYSQVGNFDKIGSITSGRSIFWKEDLEYFFRLPFYRQIIGVGYNVIYEINSLVIANIYAHNDFINIMFSNGFIGLFLYLYSYFHFFKCEIRKYKLNKLDVCVIMVIFLFNGFFNGEYNYPAAVFSIPILVNTLIACNKKEISNEQE